MCLRRLGAGASLVALLAGGIRASAPGQPQPRPPSPRLALAPCTVPQVTGEARCGTFEVFENRASATGRTLRLKVIVLAAAGGHNTGAPLFWLAGGPGVAATGSASVASNPFFTAMRADHDLVFVDQRGTGGSNPLQCDLGDDPSDLDAYFGELLPPDKVRACRRALESRADLTQYTTSIAMDDLDDVRRALGYDAIDIAAASYGALAAQVYMRRHPMRVRAVVVAGVATPRLKQPLPFARAAEHALDLTFDACAADASCSSTFPRIRGEFTQLLSRFDGGAIQVVMVDRARRAKRIVRLTRGSFVERLRLALYTTFTARVVPLIIHQAFLGDFVPFEAAAIRFNPGANVARGMYLSVTCSEGVRFITDADVARETARTFVGDYRVRVHIAACNEWPRAAVPASFLEPVASAIPILMVSGEADGSTPPWVAADAIAHFTHGRLLSIPNSGHQLDSECVTSLMKDFLRAGSASSLDAGCTSAIQRPPFATTIPPELALSTGQ